ncbi:preprotein translocase subunit SecA [Butyricicoccus sp.]|uniref:preprotein translocase subunit SecA n=1 Tax=Butyricicoccus sp. TaxID=2049021 RepID=UPI0037356DA9
MARFLEKLFGTHSDHELKRINPIADKVDALEEQYRGLTNAQLRAKTDEFRQRYQNGETLDDLLPEAFATMREAAGRVLGMRHYRVQVIGGIVLHQGRIAEMKTGEGKTLVATLPAYLNAIAGKGVHIVTVNDYLAKRDSEWMGKVYRFLGMTVGLVIHDVPPDQRKAMYQADITYGTNNEFGFDYLRDNMAIYKQNMVQRGHPFAIVDEVDSILIDEARTPLIISGRGDKSTDLYQQAENFVCRLKSYRIKETDDKLDLEAEGERLRLEEEERRANPDKAKPMTDEDREILAQLNADYVVDEKAKTAVLSAIGQKKAEQYFHIENLADPENSTLAHHINQAIRAHGIMHRDVDYVVRDNEIIIVDEFTGRLMFGRRYNEGLHQAIEAKEHVQVQRESKTLATITFQNYFRLYGKLSGMTGTALTEEDEFREIYKLDVIEIPTNRPIARMDNPDCVYRTEQGKFQAAIRKIKECHEKGQPILVGTVSIDKSELLSKMLKREGIPHNVLNAKFHEKEAEIVAQAGRLGAVTIATNMAGRGTDIVLGGNPEFMAIDALRKAGFEEAVIAEANGHADTEDPEILHAREEFQRHYDTFKKQTDADAERVRAAGGLCILGTERHESRRIDNQLRGRAGRQGDPGESNFYISMEDDLMRLFGSERVMGMLDKMGMDDETPIDQKMLSGAIESAQKKVESRNFGIRKNVLQYDDVLNTQREVIYKQRQDVLDGRDLSESILGMVDSVVATVVHGVLGEKPYVEPQDVENIKRHFLGQFLKPEDLTYNDREINDLTSDSLTNEICDIAHQVYAAKEEELTPNIMRELERVVLLRNVDEKWMDHIDAMTELRNGIRLRAYAQRDPVVEYKREGSDMYDEMIAMIREDTVRMMYTARVRVHEEPKREKVAEETATSGDQTVKKTPQKAVKKPGRNDPCPCGSGKKYKKCCGRNA